MYPEVQSSARESDEREAEEVDGSPIRNYCSAASGEGDRTRRAFDEMEEDLAVDGSRSVGG